MNMNKPHLVILPTLKAQVDPARRGQIVLTGKFITGMETIVARWPGPVTLLIETSCAPDSNLDHQWVQTKSLPYAVKLVNYDNPAIKNDLATADMVMAGISWRQNHISKICRSLDVPCVYIAEYNFKTQCQMIRVNTSNPFLRLRRWLWLWRTEMATRRALKLADGVQSNGTPAFDDYKPLVGSSLLYFDGRVSYRDMATHDDIARRYADLPDGRPLRLVFSGRLLPIKGTDDLPLLAKYLREMKVPFTMEICGDGSLFDKMLQQIDRWQLSDVVKMRGVLDFHSQLVPMMKNSVDVFVCPHRQGDPSSTFMETMACGVPIIGYDNQAFEGLHRQSHCGWVTPMNQPRKLALQIAKLHEDRQQIIDHAKRSLNFALDHCFEWTYDRRVSNMLNLLHHPVDMKVHMAPAKQNNPSTIKHSESFS